MYHDGLGINASDRMVAVEGTQAPSIRLVRGDGAPFERWEERRLKDGSVWNVYKRVFDGPELATEPGGGILFQGRWLVVVQA